MYGRLSKKNFFNLLSLYGLQAINILYPLLVIPFVSSGLGVEKMGGFIYHQSLALMGFSIVEYGFNYSATRKIARLTDSPGEISSVFSETILAKMLLAILVLFIAYFVSFSETVDAKMLFSFYPMILGGVFFPIWYFQAVQKMHLIAFPHAAAKIAGIILIYLLVGDENDQYLAAGLISLTYVFSAVMSCVVIRFGGEINFKLVSFSQVIKVLLEGRDLALGSILNGLYSNVGMVILGWAGGLSGVYLAFVGVGVKIKNSMPAVNQPFNQLVYVKVSNYYGKNGTLPPWFKAVLLTQFFVVIGFSLFAYVFSDYISVFFLGVKDYFGIIALFIVVGAMSVIRRSVFLQIAASMGIDRVMSVAGFVQFPLFLASFFLLTEFLDGATSTAVAYFLVDVVIVVYAVVVICKGRFGNEIIRH